MPKIVSNVLSYDDQPCNRCGSKRRIAKTWKESIPTLSGGSVTQLHSLIVCTNKDCQAAFDKLITEDRQKREDIKLKKEKDIKIQKNKKAKASKS